MHAYPLSQEKITTLLTNPSMKSVENFIHSLSFVEMCSLCVISRFKHSDGFSVHAIERTLAIFFRYAKEIPYKDLRQQVTYNVSISSIQRALTTLSDLDLPLMTQKEIDEHKFLDGGGFWKTSFPSKNDLIDASFLEIPSNFYRRFTPDQLRIVQVYLADKDESLDVQGFAGTGKTHVIAAILQSLPAKSVLVAAHTFSQIQAIKSKVGDEYQYMTFGALANSILSASLFKRQNYSFFRTKTNYSISFTDLFKKLEMVQIGNMTPEWTAYYVQSTVRNFCYRADSTITEKHIPKHIQLATTDRAIIISAAQRMWFMTINPQPDDQSPLPLRAFHSIKQLSLTEEVFPSKYQTIVIDEAHDLSTPMAQIIDRSPQAILTFGDDYQTFGRSLVKHRRRAQSVRRKEMSYSYRAGEQANSLYNDVLETHPVKADQPFHGAKSIETKISSYDEFIIPNKPTTFLTTDLWQVFTVLQQLDSCGAKVHVLNSTLPQVKSLISECIELYSGRVQWTKHYLLKNISCWDEFQQKFQGEAFDKLVSLLKSGLSHPQWENTCNKAKSLEPDSYTIGLIEHAKNHEFKNVVLLSDILSLPNKAKEDISKTINQIYTGISRAKYSVAIPGDLNGWLKDIRTHSVS